MPRRPSAKCYDPSDSDAIVGLRGVPGFAKVKTMTGALFHASCESDPFADAANRVAMYFSPRADAALSVIHSLRHRDGYRRRFQDCHLYTFRTGRPLKVMQYVFSSVDAANASVLGDSGTARRAVATLPKGYDGVHITVHHEGVRTRAEAWTEFILKPDAAKSLVLESRRFEQVLQYYDLVVDRDADDKVWLIIDVPTVDGVRVMAGARQWDSPDTERATFPLDRMRLVARPVWGRTVVRPSGGGAPVMIVEPGKSGATEYQVWTPGAGVSTIDWARENDYVHVKDVPLEDMRPWLPALDQLGSAPQIIKQRFWELFDRDHPGGW